MIHDSLSQSDITVFNVIQGEIRNNIRKFDLYKALIDHFLPPPPKKKIYAEYTWI